VLPIADLEEVRWGVLRRHGNPLAELAGWEEVWDLQRAENALPDEAAKTLNQTGVLVAQRCRVRHVLIGDQVGDQLAEILTGGVQVGDGFCSSDV
jgi:hypothetical protein